MDFRPWMMRQGWDYQQWNKFGSHAGQPGHRDGVVSGRDANRQMFRNRRGKQLRRT